MNLVLIQSIQIFEQVLVFLVIAKVVLSYFMDPYHPIRSRIDMLVEPILSPIRKIMPNTGMFDFSPMVLIILVQLIGTFLIALLRG